MTPAQALRDFAKELDGVRASKVQLKVGNVLYNGGVIAALKWAAELAREKAKKLESLT